MLIILLYCLYCFMLLILRLFYSNVSVVFLPRDALAHSAVLRLLSSVRLSVCLSVCNDQVP